VEGNLYIIRPGSNAIDVNKTLGARSPFPNEFEVAILYRVDPKDIRGVTPLNPDGTFKYNYSILNPSWQP